MKMDGKAGKEDKVGIVFIAGAGLKPWIWHKVAEAMDYPFLIIDASTGKDSIRSRKNFSFDDYISIMKKQVEEWGVTSFVIVAHSLGGVLGLQLASELNDRLRGFIAVGAVIPPKGGSFLSAFPFTQRMFASAMMRLLGTKPPDFAIRDGLCNDLPAELTDQIVRQFIPESIHVYTERVKASLPNVPRLYVKLSKDKQLSFSLQNQMISNLAPQEIRSMETGHLPMLANPEGLLKTLTDFMRDHVGIQNR
jgi:pimeloyl-ACP methyl ester carboxylesterase